MALSLAGSLALVLIGSAIPAVEGRAKGLIHRIDLNQAFLHGMLGFMLFAGSLHIRFDELAARKWSVLILSTVGVLISTAVVGLLAWGLLNAAGIPARLIYCLLFGALISPTDPIAVMAILRQAGVPKAMEIKIAGESLFNDGVGVVVFLGLLEIALVRRDSNPIRLAGLFLREAVGGAALGFGLGWIVYRMLCSVDNYQVEVLLSLALRRRRLRAGRRPAHVRPDRDGGGRPPDRQPGPGICHVHRPPGRIWTRSGSCSTRCSMRCYSY